MTRPCFLVVDREYAGSISTRKLVIETAKFNVITAYSAAEAVETLQKFPAVSGIVMDAGMKDWPCQKLVDALKEIGPTVPLVLISGPKTGRCERADYYLEGFDPSAILSLLRKMEPEQTAAIEAHDDVLSNAD